MSVHYGSHIQINLTNRRLTFFEGMRGSKTYPVGVGKPSTPTPTGSYKVVYKLMNPGGILGTRWIGLSIPGGNYGIHGTNNPSSIGGYVSNGCIRMYNEDVEELFPLVAIGTPVEIFKERPAAEDKSGDPGGIPPVIHLVRPGETLWEIARRYGKPVKEIAAANNLANPDLIFPGQKLVIP
ncbi:MAG: L,D-transpeptidase family protein [Firmicutes bacterium]|nr:L,D-transpeptidase family protein [Bacillota bacterium]